MKKILVVDNHPVILKFMTQLLSEAGHQVLTAQDGLSALDLLQTYTPDVMFIDLVMPNIDGKKLCRIVRRMPDFDSVRVIILSGIAVEEKINVEELGADACIAKGTFAEMSENVLRALGSCRQEVCEVQSAMLGQEAICRRAITQELLAVNRHFELILESIAEGILELNCEGRIIYANPIAKSILGIPEESFLGRELFHFFAEGDQHRIKNMLADMNFSKTAIGEDEPVCLDGNQLLVQFLPFAGEAQGTIVILNDITEKRRMAERLQQAQKMEAIGLLAGGLAHDFNNILTAILGNVSLAKMYLKSDDKSYLRLEEAEKASMRAKDLTLQLLTFARGGAPVKKKAPLAEIVNECCRYTLKNPAVRCEIALDKSLWPVDVDRGQISQAIQNLLANAEQSMPQGGVIRIAAQNKNLEEEHSLPLERGKYVELLLADQGVGISEEHLHKIFDPYFTTKSRRSGLGLTIAYSIVKNHKGYIRVESKRGQGTSFYIYLPAAHETGKNEKQRAKPILRKSRILVMDDETFVREVVGEMLDFIGFTAEFAQDGMEAVKQYEEAMNSGNRFDAVIMDLTIPEGMGGKEAVKRLLEIDPEAKVIVSSGYSEDPVMSDYKSYGFKGVAAKPFKIEELNKTLHEVISFDQ